MKLCGRIIELNSYLVVKLRKYNYMKEISRITSI